MKKFNLRIFALLLVGIFLAVTTFVCCVKKEKREAIEKETAVESNIEEKVEPKIVVIPPKVKVRPVSTISVYSTGGKITKWFSGVSVGDPTRNYAFNVPGTISDINVKAGSKLWHERIIARLDSGALKTKMEKLEVELQNARVKVLNATANRDRVRKLFENKGATVDEYKAARLAVQTALKAEHNFKKHLQAAHIRLEYHDLRVTHRGRISSINVNVNDKVQAGQTIAVLKTDMPLEITVRLPATLIAQAGIGSRGKAKFKGYKGIYPGKILEVGKLEPGPKGTFPITFRLKHVYKRLRAGLEGEVSFRFDYRFRKVRFILPAQAVGEDDQGYYVYVVKPAEGNYGTIERRSVTSGKLFAQGHEVFEGLTDGEVIVARGIGRLADGMQVKWK